MKDQHVDVNKVSLVETFPYLHRDGSGKFKQDLLGWLLENNPAFAKLVHTWVAECMQLEKEGAAEAWAAQNAGKTEPRIVIYVGGLVAAKVLEKMYGSEQLSLPGVNFELRQTKCGMVLYVQDHPSYWMMKACEAASVERFRAIMQTWPALTNCVRHGANFQEQLGESGRLQAQQEAATLAAIGMHKLDMKKVLEWCPSARHTGLAETINWAATFSQQYCGGDSDVTIRLGFSEHVRHMTPAERTRLEDRVTLRGAEIGAFGAKALGCDSFWVAARDSGEPEWKRLVGRAGQIEAFGLGALGCNALWVAARDSGEPEWGRLIGRAEQIERVEEDAFKCRACWQLLCSATPDDWETALQRITLVHQVAPEGLKANGFWQLLLKKHDEAHFAKAMDRAKQIKQSKHSDKKSSALTLDSSWDQLSKKHSDDKWARMFRVYLSFAKGAANQDLLWAVLDRNFTVAVFAKLQALMKAAVSAMRSNNKPKVDSQGNYPPSRAVLTQFLGDHHADHTIWHGPS